MTKSASRSANADSEKVSETQLEDLRREVEILELRVRKMRALGEIRGARTVRSELRK